MTNDWSRIAEQLMLSISDSKLRIVAITGLTGGAGASTAARELAATFARAGRSTLLVDLSRPMSATAADPGVEPTSALTHAPHISNETGLAELTITPTPESLPRFSNPDRLRRVLDTDLAQYETVIIDLPPVGEIDDTAINPVAAARAADAVFLVASTGTTRRDELAAASQVLRQVGAPLAGVIMNDRDCSTLGEQLARTALHGLGPIMPRLGHHIAARALASSYLNRHFLLAN